MLRILIIAVVLSACGQPVLPFKRREDKTKCPKVKVIRNFDLEEMMGHWFVVQYYASSEEDLAYKCMRAVFSVSPDLKEVSLNFTYSYTDDPDNDLLIGNITWVIPDPTHPAHWVHAEESCAATEMVTIAVGGGMTRPQAELTGGGLKRAGVTPSNEGVYNTYVLDSNYSSWSLLLHCAEKSKSPRYLSSFIMSRSHHLPDNVISFLRDKLPRYDIDLEYLFTMLQRSCNAPERVLHYAQAKKKTPSSRRHPLKHPHH